MTSAHSLQGLMKWLTRAEWRDRFAEVYDHHLLPACRRTGLDAEEVLAILGENWSAGLKIVHRRLLEVTQDLIRTALDLELADGTVVANRVGDRLCVFLTGLYRAERGIAERLLQLRGPTTTGL